MAAALESVFAELRRRMLRASATINAVTDEPGNLVLITTWLQTGKGAGVVRRSSAQKTTCRAS